MGVKQAAYPFPPLPRRWTEEERKFGLGLQYIIEQLVAKTNQQADLISSLTARVEQLEDQSNT